MNEAVFISDLHLHPYDSDIMRRFDYFIKWAALNTKSVYILGDFFHVWAGDDAIDDWSQSVADRLSWLSARGVKLFFMHGNRDFLLGNKFANLAHMTILPDPSVIKLGDESVLLSHGDQYCTKDLGHQFLMFLTRNKLFTWLFLKLPLTTRNRIVQNVRQRSRVSKNKSLLKMDVVKSSFLSQMRKHHVKNLIHGHTHKPGLIKYLIQHDTYFKYVLSDWDDNPIILCYDYTTSGLFYLGVEQWIQNQENA